MHFEITKPFSSNYNIYYTAEGNLWNVDLTKLCDFCITSSYYNLESIFDKQLPFYNQMFMCQLNFICLVQNSKHNIIHRTRIHNATNKKVYTWTIICHVIWWDVFVTNISPYSYIFCIGVLLFHSYCNTRSDSLWEWEIYILFKWSIFICIHKVIHRHIKIK